MATVQRYLNTASSGGDGTTNETSGAQAAYASMSSAEANMGGSATDNYILDCCGASADTTAVTWNFATDLTSGSLTVRGNRSDPNGFYSGPKVISTSHYRLAPASIATTLESTEDNTIFDGLQVVSAHNSTFGVAIRLTGAPLGIIVRKCRVRNAATCRTGIGGPAISVDNSGTQRIEDCLIVGFDSFGIEISTGNFFSPTWHITHNTIYGDGSSSVGIQIESTGASAAATFHVKGNAVANSGASNDIVASLSGTSTVIYADNATEDFDLGTTDEIDLGAPADAWTNPGTGETSEFTVKGIGSSLYNAVSPTLLTSDITDFTRDGTNHDVGAFELLVPLESLRASGPGLAVGSPNSFIGDGAVGASPDPTLVLWDSFAKATPWRQGPPGLNRLFARPFETWETPAITGTTVTPSPIIAVFSIPAPTLVKGGVTMAPTPVVATFSVPAPTLINIRVLTPSAVVATFSIPAPTLVKGGVTTAPSPVVATFSIPAPTVVKGGVTMVPSPVVAVFSVPVITLFQGKTLSPSPVVATFSIPTPTVVKGGVTMVPSPVVATFSIPAPTVVKGGRTMTPSPVVATFSIPAPTIFQGISLSPSPVVAVFSIPAPTVVKGGVTMSPSPVVAVFSIPAPTVVKGGRTMTPSPVVAVFSVPAVTLVNVKVLVPAPVVAVFSVPMPTVIKGLRTISVTPAVAQFVIPSPNVLSATIKIIYGSPGVARLGSVLTSSRLGDVLSPSVLEAEL